MVQRLIYFGINLSTLSTRSNIGSTNKWDSTTTFKQLFECRSVNLDVSTLNKEPYLFFCYY